MATVLDKGMHSYFVQLNEDEKKSVVQMLRTFLKAMNKNGEHITIEQYNEEIDDAMREVKMGEVFTHEEVVKMAKNG